ncbi:hypothetical protein [Elizabethkingia anophelis]|uniref:hypothetical protein n=1 Tax=Elizabethkingia anophelis TaxID=1117645 RepID=UPI0016294E1F|nr:hypothetical protein [Elizabethkingia anophelis]
MSEFKGTKGKWYVERTSEENSDYQARILSNVGKVFHAGELKDQIMIIVGEPKKQNGYANIHLEANAKLISKAPEMLAWMIKKYEKLNSVELNINSEAYKDYSELKQLIKEATE